MNSIRQKLFVLTLSVGSVLGVGATTCAHAAEATQIDAPQITVSYRDLDLSRPADTHVLYRRLRKAAADVCPHISSLDMLGRMSAQSCYNAALEQAVLRINAPQLLSLHRAETNALAGRG